VSPGNVAAVGWAAVAAALDTVRVELHAVPTANARIGTRRVMRNAVLQLDARTQPIMARSRGSEPLGSGAFKRVRALEKGSGERGNGPSVIG